MIRKEVVECAIKNGKHIEKAIFYATEKADVKDISTADLTQGSMLFVIRDAKMYLLDEDGGAWYNASTGVALSEEE